MRNTSDLTKLTAIFLVAKSVQYSLLLLSPSSPFDTSTQLLLSQLAPNSSSSSSSSSRLYNKLLSWDAAFFIKNMLHAPSPPQYEHEYAFSPLWSGLVSQLVSRLSPDPPPHNLHRLLLSALLLQLALHYFSVILLYFLTLQTFKQNILKFHRPHDLALKTAILFIFSSAAGFLTSIYSEPLSFALAFLGIYARQLSISYDLYANLNCHWPCLPVYTLLSTACFSLASLNRSNCILLGLYYLFDSFNLARSKRFLQLLFFPLLSGSLLALVFYYHHFHLPYSVFCPQRREWCLKKLLHYPLTYQSFYSFIQNRYWNLGLLNYWTLNNLPNLLLALPNILLICYSSVYFSHHYPCANLLPLLWISRILLFILVFFAHVQIINRVFSFVPLQLWYLADRLNKTQPIKHDKPQGDDRLVKFYIYWLIFWIPLQTILFASFLPPA